MIAKEMDKIVISKLKASAIIGIYPQERLSPQPLTIDIEFKTNISHAVQTDCIDNAVDYYSLSRRTIEFIEQTQFQLLETLAEQTARFILREFQIKWLKLKISKPKALTGMADNVGIQIVRTCVPKNNR